jgi:hypothetical protein
MQFKLLRPHLLDIFCTLGMLFKCPKVGCFYPGKMNEVYGIVFWPFIALVDSDKFVLWKNLAE